MFFKENNNSLEIKIIQSIYFLKSQKLNGIIKIIGRSEVNTLKKNSYLFQLQYNEMYKF